MNQNLSKLGAQLTEIWKQLGVGQRVVILAATLVLVAGLAALTLWSSSPDYSLLYGRLSDIESVKVLAALDDAKIPYKLGPGGSSIMIPADKVHLTRMQLAERGIPQADGVGLEISNNTNFGVSDFVQRANYIRTLQNELARAISQLDDVESARVMIALPENSLFLDKDFHPTASVFVRVHGNTQLQPQSINSIRFLVANSVEGLKPANVSVVDNLGNILSEISDNDSLSGLTSAQLAARRNLEQYLAKKAQDILERVLGPGQAIVRVSAEMNFDTTTRTEEKFDPDGQVIRTQTRDDENNDSATSGTNFAQAGNIPAHGLKNHKTTSTVQYDNPKSTSNTLQSAGGVKRLSAAVTVASRFDGIGSDRKVVPRTTEELEKLRRIAQTALGIQSGSDNTRGDLITLEELPFSDQSAIDVSRQLDPQQKHQFWWDFARNAGYPLLAVASLVILVVVFKRSPVPDVPVASPVNRISTIGQGPIDEPTRRSHRTVTVEVLNRLVKENPANMTQAIRDWMNKNRTSDQ